MYDSLESIERNFGSVAEYNRVMAEEMEFDPELGCYVPVEYEEPSEEELEREAKEQRIYNRKLEALSGIPSEWAINLNKELDKLAPKKKDYDSNAYYYACREFSSYRTDMVIEGIKETYGIVLSKDVSPYRLDEGDFAVEIDDRNKCPVVHYAARGLTYEQFKAVFRDLRYLDKNPTMFFGRGGEHNTLILSNSSLGSLRYCDLSHYSVLNDTREAMDKEALAANKALYEANIDKVRHYDGQCNKNMFKRCEHYHYIGQISEDDPNEYCYCDIGSHCTYEEMIARKKEVAA